jgi:hypothetical protein
MGNPRPVFRAAPVEADGPFLPLGEKGLRGRLRHGSVSRRAITWERAGVGGPLSAGGPLEIHYRLGRDRNGGLQLEILAARPAPRT